MRFYQVISKPGNHFWYTFRQFACFYHSKHSLVTSSVCLCSMKWNGTKICCSTGCKMDTKMSPDVAFYFLRQTQEAACCRDAQMYYNARLTMLMAVADVYQLCYINFAPAICSEMVWWRAKRLQSKARKCFVSSSNILTSQNVKQSQFTLPWKFLEACCIYSSLFGVVWIKGRRKVK